MCLTSRRTSEALNISVMASVSCFEPASTYPNLPIWLTTMPLPNIRLPCTFPSSAHVQTGV